MRVPSFYQFCYLSYVDVEPTEQTKWCGQKSNGYRSRLADTRGIPKAWLPAATFSFRGHQYITLQISVLSLNLLSAKLCLDWVSRCTRLDAYERLEWKDRQSSGRVTAHCIGYGSKISTWEGAHERMNDLDGVAVVGCLMTLVSIYSPFSANYNPYFIDLVQREYKSSIVYFC